MDKRNISRPKYKGIFFQWIISFVQLLYPFINDYSDELNDDKLYVLGEKIMEPQENELMYTTLRSHCIRKRKTKKKNIDLPYDKAVFVENGPKVDLIKKNGN